MADDKPVIVKPTPDDIQQHGNLPKQPAQVPLTSGDKKPRGWYIYQREAICIANSRGVSKGITAPPEKKPPKQSGVRVTGYVVTDPRFVDYNPPPVHFKLDPLKFRGNPFEYKEPVFIDSSYVEDPAYASGNEVLRKR